MSPKYQEKTTELVNIENSIIERNKRYLHKARITPYTIEPLAPLLGYDSLVKLWKSNTARNIRSYLKQSVSSTIILVFKNQSSKQELSPLISIKNITDGFRS